MIIIKTPLFCKCCGCVGKEEVLDKEWNFPLSHQFHKNSLSLYNKFWTYQDNAGWDRTRHNEINLHSYLKKKWTKYWTTLWVFLRGQGSSIPRITSIYVRAICRSMTLCDSVWQQSSQMPTNNRRNQQNTNNTPDQSLECFKGVCHFPCFKFESTVKEDTYDTDVVGR